MNNPCPGPSCTLNCTCMVHNHAGHEKSTTVRDCPAHGETERGAENVSAQTAARGEDGNP